MHSSGYPGWGLRATVLRARQADPTSALAGKGRNAAAAAHGEERAAEGAGDSGGTPANE